MYKKEAKKKSIPFFIIVIIISVSCLQLLRESQLQRFLSLLFRIMKLDLLSNEFVTRGVATREGFVVRSPWFCSWGSGLVRVVRTRISISDGLKLLDRRGFTLEGEERMPLALDGRTLCYQTIFLNPSLRLESSAISQRLYLLQNIQRRSLTHADLLDTSMSFQSKQISTISSVYVLLHHFSKLNTSRIMHRTWAYRLDSIKRHTILGLDVGMNFSLRRLENLNIGVQTLEFCPLLGLQQSPTIHQHNHSTISSQHHLLGPVLSCYCSEMKYRLLFSTYLASALDPPHEL